MITSVCGLREPRPLGFERDQFGTLGPVAELPSERSDLLAQLVSAREVALGASLLALLEQAAGLRIDRANIAHGVERAEAVKPDHAEHLAQIAIADQRAAVGLAHPL